jgi:hypothetical protein
LLEFVAPLYCTLKEAVSKTLNRLNQQRMLGQIGFSVGTQATRFEFAA